MSTVLLVEDTLDCRLPLARLLRHHGHAVECADNGAEALRILESFSPDWIILDLMMPVMDGFSFLQAFSQSTQARQTRVVVYTGHSEERAVERLTALGASAVLTKGSTDYNKLLALMNVPSN